jgi:endonuclease/exonuclease/phosphatase (EEP) superfamily protein YafD
MRTYHPYLVAALVLAAATVLAFSPDAWVPMMARAFMLQWALAFAALTLFLLVRSYRPVAFAGLAGALLCGVQLLPTSAPAAAARQGEALRVLHINVFQPNTKHAEIVELILGSGADLVSVQEVTPQWASALLHGLAEEYPYHRIEPRINCYGLAVFSRSPWERSQVHGEASAPFFEVHVEKGGQTIQVLVAHTTSPDGPAQWRSRNRQLDELALRVEAGNSLLVGDLNTVPWDEAYRRFCRRSGMHPATFLPTCTWPVLGPVALIPLDHVLLKGDLQVRSVTPVHVPGSDHRGLLADVVVNMPDPMPTGSAH